MNAQEILTIKKRQYTKALLELQKVVSRELLALENGQDASNGLGSIFSQVAELNSQVKVLTELAWEEIDKQVYEEMRESAEKDAQEVCATVDNTTGDITPTTEGSPIIIKGSPEKVTCIENILRNFSKVKTMEDMKEYGVPTTEKQVRDYLRNRLDSCPKQEGFTREEWNTELFMQAVRMECTGKNFWIAANTTLGWVRSQN